MTKLKIWPMAIGCMAIGHGCTNEPTGPSRLPVVSMVLIGGDSIHLASITLSALPDSIVPIPSTPVAPSEVALTIQDQGSGNVYPVVPTGIPGLFSSTFVANPGSTYALAGVVAGRQLAAETTVPSSFSIVAPSSDTITTADGVPSFVALRLPLEVAGVGVTGFEYRILGGLDSILSGGVIQSSTSTLLLLREDPVRRFLVLGYNDDAARWLVRQTHVGNISGAFGVFGGALLSQKYLHIP